MLQICDNHFPFMKSFFYLIRYTRLTLLSLEILSSFLQEVELLSNSHCDKVLRLNLEVFAKVVDMLFSSAILFIKPLLLIAPLNKHVLHHGIASDRPLIWSSVVLN